jgi:ribosomal protein S18 acetylase RimI-like enzyme
MNEVRDRDRLRALLRRDPALHVYELADLDDRFWPHTRWFVEGDAVALLYTANDPPVVVALGDGQAPLLRALRDELPPAVYAHLSPGLAGCLQPRFVDDARGAYGKMRLADARVVRARAADVADAVAFAPDHADELVAFYRHAYPGGWFDPRMLDTGYFRGVRVDGAIVAAAGVHACSQRERIAAIGNVAVAEAWRGHGLAARVTAATCIALLADVDVVGLNVKADNAAAIACYRRLGFVAVAPYEEHLFTRQSAVI